MLITKIKKKGKGTSTFPPDKNKTKSIVFFSGKFQIQKTNSLSLSALCPVSVTLSVSFLASSWSWRPSSSTTTTTITDLNLNSSYIHIHPSINPRSLHPLTIQLPVSVVHTYKSLSLFSNFKIQQHKHHDICNVQGSTSNWNQVTRQSASPASSIRKCHFNFSKSILILLLSTLFMVQN